MRRRGRSHRRPLYRLVADEIRAAIDDGTLQPGQLLPPEKALAERFDVSLVAVRAGLGVLRGEGRIVTERGKGSRVREIPERTVVKVPPGARITARMPTEAERRRLSLAEGTPVLEVELRGEVRILPGDRHMLETINDVDNVSNR